MFLGNGRDKSQEIRSQLPSARLVGEKREKPTHCSQGQQNQQGGGETEENVEDEKPNDTNIDEQFDGDESRIGNVVPAHIQNGLDAHHGDHVYGKRFKSISEKLFSS